MSLRGFLRIGSSCSVYGMVRLWSWLSILDIGHFGSTLSCRSFCRIGSSLSVYGM
jgi:hypothetical protein